MGLPPWLRGFDCPPPLVNNPKPTLKRPEREWSMLPTLHGDSGGRFVVAQLMAPKPITMWGWALLFHGGRFKVVKCW